MKTLVLLLIVLPLLAQAQPDTLRPIRVQDLKPITYDIMTINNGRYTSARMQYMYDGLDIRARDLEKYIRASGDVDAITAYERYKSRRESSGLAIGIGSGMYIGGLIGIISAGRNNLSKQTASSVPRNPYNQTTTYRGGGGAIIALLGVGVAAWGFSLRAPGQNVRRAVQHYNRALKQQGISWQVQPYSSVTNSGVGLVGRF